MRHETKRTRTTAGGSDPERIGLIAGWGGYPIVVAEALRQSGHSVFCAGIKAHADSQLADICHEFEWFGLAKMGSQLNFFRKHQVHKATMAGKIFKTLLLRKYHLWHHLPDWKCIRHFYPIYIARRSNRNDDTLLATATQLFESGGVHIAPATDFVPELLVKRGLLTKRKISTAQWHDIQFGWGLAKAMGHLDVGQAVAVKNRSVLAVEAVEGTDNCIRRAGELCTAGGIVVVKVAKPHQDMRFDVPTVGLSTIETMHDSGATVLAIEADRTIILDQRRMIERANSLGIAVVAVPDEQPITMPTGV